LCRSNNGYRYTDFSTAELIKNFPRIGIFSIAGLAADRVFLSKKDLIVMRNDSSAYIIGMGARGRYVFLEPDEFFKHISNILFRHECTLKMQFPKVNMESLQVLGAERDAALKLINQAARMARRELALEANESVIPELVFPEAPENASVIKIAGISDYPLTDLARAFMEHPHATMRVSSGKINSSKKNDRNLLRNNDILISVRLNNCLNKDNIAFLAELIEKPDRDLLIIPSFSRKSLFEAEQTLLENGLTQGEPLFGAPLSDYYSDIEIREALETARKIRDQFGIKPGQACRIEDKKDVAPAELIDTASAQVTEPVYKKKNDHSAVTNPHRLASQAAVQRAAVRSTRKWAGQVRQFARLSS